MPDLTLYFECQPTADSARLSDKLQAGLQQIPQIATAETLPTPPGEEPRITGLEILAAITLTAKLIHQGSQIAHDIRSIVEDLKATFKAIAGSTPKQEVQSVRVSVGLEPKPIEELTEEDYRILAEDLQDNWRSLKA